MGPGVKAQLPSTNTSVLILVLKVFVLAYGLFSDTLRDAID